MHLKVTYGVSWICVVRSSHVRLCSLFHAPNRMFVLLFLPLLPSLIGRFGKYWVGKNQYLNWLGHSDGAWWVVATRRVVMDTCVPCSRLVAQGLLPALESPPTLTGTIPKLIYWWWLFNLGQIRREKEKDMQEHTHIQHTQKRLIILYIQI